MDQNTTYDILSKLRSRFNSSNGNGHPSRNEKTSGEETVQQDQRTLISKLIKSIEDDLLGTLPGVYLSGKKIGGFLTENIDPHIKLIEEKYDQLAALLSNIANQETIQEFEEAKIKTKIIEERIKKIECNLNEKEPDSEINRINTKIKEKIQIIQNYDKDNYENQFIQKYYSFFNQRLLHDEATIQNFLNHEKKTEERINKLLYRDTSDDLIKKDNKKFDDDDENSIKEIDLKNNKEDIENSKELNDKKSDSQSRKLNKETKQDTNTGNVETNRNKPSLLKKFISLLRRKKPNKSKEIQSEQDPAKEFINRTRELHEIKEKDLRKREAIHINPIYDSIDKTLREFEPIIPPRSLVIINYLISIIILFGEFYLVYEVLTKVLNFEVPNKIRDFFSIKFFIIIFCIAYPLVIGMTYKLSIKDPISKEKFKQDFSKTWKWVILLSLLLLGGVASLTLLDSEKAIKRILEIWFSKGAGDYLIFYKTIAVALFLPVITILFATIGSIFLIDTMILHKQFYHATKSHLFSLKKWRGKDRRRKHSSFFINKIEEEIETLEEKIQNLRLEKEEIEEEYIRIKAYADSKKSSTDFKNFTDTLKAIAKELFLSGFEEGKAQTVREINETDLILYIQKRKYLQK